MRRPAFVLPVVLVLVGLLALAMASFMWFVRAEVRGVQADRDAEQVRLAAESGLQELIIYLRKSSQDPNEWFDVPDRFRHVLVWSPVYTRQDDPVRKAGSRRDILTLHAPPEAYRYSVVAPAHDTFEDVFRYGITPENSKLNINTASETELERLLFEVLSPLGVENSQELTQALLDWRDADDEMRPNGAEVEYYNTLSPPYQPRNGPFTTIEELLLVKGFSAAVLYGEDVNRNGLLDRNEDDGTASPPLYDNGDGVLNRGLAAYLTTWSREPATGRRNPGGQPGGGEQTGEGEEDGEGNPGGGEMLEGGAEEGGPIEPSDGKSSGRRQSLDEQEALRRLQALAGGLETGDPNDPNDPNAAPPIVKVNVNTAPLQVLRVLDGMTPEAAEQIVAYRQELAPDAMKDLQWVAQVVDPETLAAVQGKLTTKSQQFHIEIVGYADHTKLVRRYEWIVDLRSQVVQVLYHRDLSRLGFAWPVDDDRVVIRRR